jgi:hypothetical protein
MVEDFHEISISNSSDRASIRESSDVGAAAVFGQSHIQLYYSTGDSERADYATGFGDEPSNGPGADEPSQGGTYQQTRLEDG